MLFAAVNADEPEVKVAHIGSTTTLSCVATNWKDLIWTFSSSLFESWRIISKYPNVTERFTARHSVSYNNLSISDIRLCDAGVYRCMFTSGNVWSAANIQLIIGGKFISVAKINHNVIANNNSHMKL